MQGKTSISLICGYYFFKSTHAFTDCYALKKIVILESVSVIGDEVFPRVDRNPNRKLKLTDIEVSPKSGLKKIGSKVFAFPFGDEPLTYPKPPVTFVKEATTQVRLGMGFCQHPEKFEGEYANIYKKYVTSHEKTIVRRQSILSSQMLKLTTMHRIQLILKRKPPSSLMFPQRSSAILPNSSCWKISSKKVQLKMLSTINYEFSTALQRKYKMNQHTEAGSYRTEYYHMLESV